MKKLVCNRKQLVTARALRMKVLVMLILFAISSAWASQGDGYGPSSDFINGKVAVRTETGTSNLSIRLVEFLMGIQTDKSWEKRSDTIWILKTGFKDPVTDTHKIYVLEFERIDDIIILSAVSFDNHMLSHHEVKSFADQIIRNFGKHVSPK